MIAKIERLRMQVDKACHDLEVALKREFPVGSRITWMARNGKYVQYGVVEYIGNLDGHNPEMRVENENTGKLVWVRLWQNPYRI